MQDLHTGNTTGNRFPYFRNRVNSRALLKKTGTVWPVLSLLFQKASTSSPSTSSHVHIVWPIICCCFKKKVPVWIFLGRGHKLFIIPHHMCVSFPYLYHLYAGCNFERGIYMLWNSISRFLYFFISCPLTWEGIWKSHTVLYIHTHTHTQNIIFIWLIVNVGFYIVLLY